MGYYEFPHTRNYDTDLGYLIKRYFELSTDFESLEKNFDDLKAWCIAQLNSEALKTLVANKLDEWLQDGTLEALINNPLNHVTTYDTVVEMLPHSALLEGSKVYCAGADSVNDGKGGHFRIRARLSSDVIDNYNLYLIDGGIKVAERIDSTDKKTKNYVLLSDSYGTPEGSGGVSWIEQLKQTINVTQSNGYSGASFGGPVKFENIWNTLNSDPTVTDIIILCGANDGGYLDSGGNPQDIINGMSNSFTILKEKFNNAEIHLGFIGRTTQHHESWKKACGIYAQYSGGFNVKFIENCQYILHNTIYLSSTDHPTQDGSNRIVNYITNYINNGYISVQETTDVEIGNGHIKTFTNNGITTIMATGTENYLTFTGSFIIGNQYYNSLSNIQLPNFVPQYVIPVTVGCKFVQDSTDYYCPVQLGIAKNSIVFTGQGNPNPTKTNVNTINVGMFCVSVDSMMC